MALNTYTEPDYVLTLREQLRLVRNMPVIPEGGAKTKKSLTALTRGDYLRFNGVIYLVEEKSEYREGKWKWHELHLLDLVTGHQTFLEYEQDDRLEAAVWESGELELSDMEIGRAHV
jgi:translation elongation factor P/translation initiation factor 5A